MIIRKSLFGLLVSIGMCVGAASAATVNFDVPGGDGGTNYAGTGADTGGTIAEYWNPIVTNSTTTAGLQSDGSTSTPITFTEAENTNYNGNNANNPLFQPFAIETTTGGLNQTLNHVPAGVYNLFLYGVNGGYGDGRSTTFTVSNSTTSYGSMTETSTANYAANTYVAGGNYVEFTNISPDASGTITINYNTPKGDTTESDFNGLQLVSTSVSTPLPASVFGGLALWAGLFISRMRRASRAQIPLEPRACEGIELFCRSAFFATK